MALQIRTNIDIDFCDNKYIRIDAKQYDKNSRFLSFTCYNRGEIYSLNSGEHAAYIRYRKADGYGVFNFCEIDYRGKILVELTEQMLASEGICCADLVIVNKGEADVNTETGEIITINNASILSTMILYISVTATPIENSDIESSYEYDALNKLLIDATASYEEVVKNARSWAVGSTGNGRKNEDIDNAKYYSELAGRSSNSADISEANALSYSKLSQSYAIGGTGVRTNENYDNSQYYYNLTKGIVNGLNSGFIPMGTIAFSELSSVEKAIGFTYNISDDFVTDDSFMEGSGKSYTAGTNVYFTASDKWDCFGGAASPTATIDEVKDYLGI